MKKILKPIQFVDLKDEIEINIIGNKTVQEFIEEVEKFCPRIGKDIHFMFRGKKLINEKTLEDQGIKEGTKLMMYKSVTKNETKEVISHRNKEEAKLALIKMGFKNDMIRVCNKNH